MIVQICVGSSCHLKGSQAIVEMLQQAISDNHLDNDVTLAGSFCTGKCNRYGVTITVDDEIYTGITRENFSEFFQEKILKPIQATGV
ncbi:MAG TPA: (2Fe-2S) ferredoxin domain-containing protein [Candidatus Faeciplasma pullistercoris]|uniref:(2Fe-2S) ferredoxin domain-containing protein n=1 Tax=Candidatus Faeciplasma pullistercoris TaxID=2840800 RepID=A0A9D1GSD5_9FIRM|nr:(2Fe-2S) ferredoxin domain-containing protein [Candidatus Faeciplasma pullistercoris]